MSVSESREDRSQEEIKDTSILPKLRKGLEPTNRYLNTRVANPQTPPSRFIPSNYSSPGSTYGKEEDSVVIEITPRYILAGIEGESDPQCRISFTPDTSRRVGDYREWLPGSKRQESMKAWGHEYELWRNRVADLDLSVVGDRLERAVREAYNNYLLMDAGSSRLVLVAPSIVPRPVLETILYTLFERWRYPTITLLPAPMASTISAGLRSALVIDIGWEETVATCVYEYREIFSHRSTRAMKLFTRNVASALKMLVSSRSDSKSLPLDLCTVEEIASRILHSTSSLEVGPANDVEGTDSDWHEIDWSTDSSTELVRVPISLIPLAAQRTFFHVAKDHFPDDEELNLPDLAFKALLSLSPDIRSVCLSRIVFIGEGSKFRILKSRSLSELSSLIRTNGWSHIKGEHAGSVRPKPELSQWRAEAADAKHNISIRNEGDYVEDQVRRRKAKLATTDVHSEVTEVDSLGSWAGASLLTSLKIRGLVEIERDRFLSHGLNDASREAEGSVAAQPQRIGVFGVTKSVKAPDRTGWTLAGWG